VLHHRVLDQLASSGVRLGLERVRAFLQYLGEPERAYPVVHVAGTNGKGSTCAFLTYALMAAGYRVGTMMSPHLEAVNERILIDGRPIDDPLFADAIEALDRARWEWASSARIQESPLTYFEFLTCLGFQLFAQRQVDVAVVEVGMGGRLDATNVVQPLVTAITHIGIDHVDQLGTRFEDIAAEKAGILKRGVPVVVGSMPIEARTVIENRARSLGCANWLPGRHLMREYRSGTWTFTTPDGTHTDVELSLEGLHQGANAGVAVGILHMLRRVGFFVPDQAIVSGLATTSLPGRLEQILPGLVLDGAHNEDGARVLAQWLKRRPRVGTRILLWGMSGGRDPVRAIEPLLGQVDEVVTTRCAHPRSRDPLELALMYQDLEVVLSEGGPIEDALPEVYQEANETVVAGSLFLVGAARSLVRSGVLDGITPGQGPSE